MARRNPQAVRCVGRADPKLRCWVAHEHAIRVGPLPGRKGCWGYSVNRTNHKILVLLAAVTTSSSGLFSSGPVRWIPLSRVMQENPLRLLPAACTVLALMLTLSRFPLRFLAVAGSPAARTGRRPVLASRPADNARGPLPQAPKACTRASVLHNAHSVTSITVTGG